ncbi:ABC transporter substrate-binding protein [Uliginosibacterium gangwonense]|uniref:ABC transporter substrate-binding protein n=1 Tax=Uliginosibacterium gangwonense TaxID=392736 RepID=UPI0003821F11|nr:ABC transporter substrate-binding protein [Uliginosibacterium gangwonense]
MWKLLGTLFLLSLAACQEKPPLRIGFIGSTSGRFADLGVAGRNGAQLAIDLRNAAGGIKGRKLELIAEDDKNDRDTAIKGFRALEQAKVEAIIGPVTSSMATALVPLTNQANLVMISPTVTTTLLSGKDDQFFRVVASVKTFAERMAKTLCSQHQLSKAVIISDIANADYTRSWEIAFSAAYIAQNCSVGKALEFDSRAERNYGDLADAALRTQPQVVVFIASATDTALLAQKLKQKNPKVMLAVTGWSATDRLIELGGQAVEGTLAEQYYDPFSQSKNYLEFRNTYAKRFGEEPGFSGTLGFDAATVILNAIDKQEKGLSLKETLLKTRHFAGLQEDIDFDPNGDVFRSRHITFVRNGRFEPID